MLGKIESMKNLLLAVVALVVLAFFFSGHANYWLNKPWMDDIAKQPHTAQLLDYSISFPRAADLQSSIPGGLDAGVEVSGPGRNLDGELPKENLNYEARWRIPDGGGYIEFLVWDKIPPAEKSKRIGDPFGFRNIKRTPAGPAQVSGLNFDGVKWVGDYDDAGTLRPNIPGITYETFTSDGKLVVLRGIGFGTPGLTEKLTASVLQTLKKRPLEMRNQQLDGKTESVPYGLIMP
jgi:hypothetical protein